ncbi:MAG: polyribonucleotide nucleotidyltransferase [Candidatus Brocadiaceae bacterium]
MKEKVERTIAGRQLSIETGELAKQADAAVVVRYGDSMVLVTAVAEEDTRNVPFLPLTVEYREKQYAAGQFPGGVIKREGRPTTKEILTCRLVDRPIRPLFPEGYHQDIQVVAWVLSADEDNDPDVLALIGASAALSLSDIPWRGPVGACRVGLEEDEFVINPTHPQREGGELDIVVCSTADAVVMLEGSARTIPEDDLSTAIQCGHDVNVAIVEMIQELVQKHGRPERPWEPLLRLEKAMEALEPRYAERLSQASRTPRKDEWSEAMSEMRQEAIEELCDPEDEEALTEREVRTGLGELENRIMRQTIAQEGRRLDGRSLDEIRPLNCQVDVLPRTHGSAVFTRGETQALAVATLGTVQDEQRILDPLIEEEPKKFLLHYNFPPFSVGEVRPIRGPGRREIGHGELAERALVPVLPSSDDFPYTVRIVADILESNGSSSMASVCGGTLCLMDAGVPIKNPVAGIALGLVKEGDQTFLLTDIAGAEDHHGDMDLKVAGTQHGVTAVQMDLKVKGVGMEVLREAFSRAREARMQILRAMLSVLQRPREEISPYAPRLIRLHIDPDMIGKLIGPGGKTIKGLEEQYDSTIEVEDDGTVTISGKDAEKAEAAARYIEQLGQKVQVGAIYDGRVTEIKDFGAIVELFPGADGLCHISELADSYVKEVTDICSVGDDIKVKVLSADDRSVRLSRRAALQEADQS